MNYTDVMLDLETMGNRSNTAIVSIGAVEFNIVTGETGREFYKVVDLQSCLDEGLKVQASTIYWWMQQDQKARERICEKGEHIAMVLEDFNVWMQDCVDKVRIWGNGARFDIGILEDAYVACCMDTPWNFRKEMDVRTLVSFAPHVKENMPFEGVYHDPVDDCKHQIKYCSKIWNMFFRTLDESEINQSSK
jgi:hypothetical protein